MRASGPAIPAACGVGTRECPRYGPSRVVPARIYACQHRGLVDLQQEHLSEAVGQLQLVLRSAADVQRRWCCGPDQFIQAGRIPCPAVLGKPGKVRFFRLFFHYVASGVDGPRKQRVVVGVDGCQAPAGEHGGDRGLPGAGTACDLNSAHRCLSWASSDSGRKCVCAPVRDAREHFSSGPGHGTAREESERCRAGDSSSGLGAEDRGPAALDVFRFRRQQHQRRDADTRSIQRPRLVRCQQSLHLKAQCHSACLIAGYPSLPLPRHLSLLAGSFRIFVDCYPPYGGVFDPQ